MTSLKFHFQQMSTAKSGKRSALQTFIQTKLSRATSGWLHPYGQEWLSSQWLRKSSSIRLVCQKIRGLLATEDVSKLSFLAKSAIPFFPSPTYDGLHWKDTLLKELILLNFLVICLVVKSSCFRNMVRS